MLTISILALILLKLQYNEKIKDNFKSKDLSQNHDLQIFIVKETKATLQLRNTINRDYMIFF